MRIKRIFVGIKKLDGALNEAGLAFEEVSKGKLIKKKRAIYFSNLKEMRRILTERRLDLLKTIKDKKPSSVYELARILNRDLKNVLQDVSYLEEIGIIAVTKAGDKKVPRFNYDRISFEVAV
jgi:predicted transcriptional regulator